MINLQFVVERVQQTQILINFRTGLWNFVTELIFQLIFQFLSLERRVVMQQATIAVMIWPAFGISWRIHIMLEFTISALVIPSTYWSTQAVDLADGADIMVLFINQDIHGVLLIVYKSYIMSHNLWHISKINSKPLQIWGTIVSFIVYHFVWSCIPALVFHRGFWEPINPSF